MTNQVTMNGIPAIENLQQEDANRKKSSSFQITRVITKMTDDNGTDSPGYDNDDDEDEGESDSEVSDKDETDYKMSTYHENGNLVSFPLVNQSENVQMMPPAPLVNSINMPRPNVPSQFHTVNQQFPSQNNQFHSNGISNQVTHQIPSNNIHSNIQILHANQSQPSIVQQSQPQQQSQKQPQQQPQQSQQQHQPQQSQQPLQPQHQQQQNPQITNGNNKQHQVNQLAGISQSDISLMINSAETQLATKSALADISKSAHNFNKVKLPGIKDSSKPVHLCEPSRFKVVKIENKNPYKRGRWSCFDYFEDEKLEKSEIPSKFVIDKSNLSYSATSYSSSGASGQPSVKPPQSQLKQSQSQQQIPQISSQQMQQQQIQQFHQIQQQIQHMQSQQQMQYQSSHMHGLPNNHMPLQMHQQQALPVTQAAQQQQQQTNQQQLPQQNNQFQGNNLPNVAHSQSNLHQPINQMHNQQQHIPNQQQQQQNQQQQQQNQQQQQQQNQQQQQQTQQQVQSQQNLPIQSQPLHHVQQSQPLIPQQQQPQSLQQMPSHQMQQSQPLQQLPHISHQPPSSQHQPLLQQSACHTSQTIVQPQNSKPHTIMPQQQPQQQISRQMTQTVQPTVQSSQQQIHMPQIQHSNQSNVPMVQPQQVNPVQPVSQQVNQPPSQQQPQPQQPPNSQLQMSQTVHQVQPCANQSNEHSQVQLNNQQQQQQEQIQQQQQQQPLQQNNSNNHLSQHNQAIAPPLHLQSNNIQHSLSSDEIARHVNALTNNHSDSELFSQNSATTISASASSTMPATTVSLKEAETLSEVSMRDSSSSHSMTSSETMSCTEASHVSNAMSARSNGIFDSGISSTAMTTSMTTSMISQMDPSATDDCQSEYYSEQVVSSSSQSVNSKDDLDPSTMTEHIEDDLAYSSSGGGGSSGQSFPVTSVHRGGPGDDMANLYNQLQSHFADSHSDSTPGINSASLRYSSGLNVSANLSAGSAGLSPSPNPNGSANQSFATSPPLNNHLLKDDGESGTSTVAIDDKIEQAMDLVKSHLVFAVREEVEILKEQIVLKDLQYKELLEKYTQLELENSLIRHSASPIENHIVTTTTTTQSPSK